MTSTASDEALLAAFLGGKPDALGRLAERYETPLLGLCLGILGGERDLACDAVQETWLRVIRFGSRFDHRSSLKTWLYRIAINQSRTLLAARRDVESDDVLQAAAARDRPPADAAETCDRNAALRQAVARLDEDRRVIVLLCYHGGMTHEQAAEILELPLGTLKSRLHAALNELRTLLRVENSHERLADAGT